MATRLYLPSTSSAPAISPVDDAAWTHTQNFARAIASATKIASAMTTYSHTNGSTADKWIIVRQYIFGPLAAQTIAGTVSGRARGIESAGSVDALHAIGIRTIAPDGSTVRGTNKAVGTGGIEYATSLTNRSLASAAALTSVDAQDGDYLVIEIGLRQPVSVSANTSGISLGDDSASDLPVDNTETNPFNPWVEFSQDIALFAPGTVPDLFDSKLFRGPALFGGGLIYV
jgi:hypothetical protein